MAVEDILNLIPDKTSKADEKLIIKAYNLAEQAHSGQTRLSGEPYFIHVFETAKTLASLGMDTPTIIAGLLHDLLEDTTVTEEEIEREFGKDILFLIKGVTKLMALKYSGYTRHVESLRKFFIAMAQDVRVVMIKFADRLHNLRTLEYVREDKRKRIALESIEVYAPLANRLGMGHLKGEIEDEAFPYVYPDEYEETKKLLKEKREVYEAYLAEVREKLSGELKKNKIKFIEIDYRVKHIYSLYKKLLRYNMDIEKIYDIIALRVIVPSVEDCYRVLGLIHSLWNPLPGRIKDYIALPKPNGYRALHTTIFTGSGGVAEIQIRTKEMQIEAEYGVAAHFIYKESTKKKKSKIDHGKLQWIEELKNLNYTPSKPKKFLRNLKTDFFNDRIFIFTPKGDVVDLPEGSSPIDFAYAIHSDIGNHIAGAQVNGKMTQIFSKLKNGDIVKIVANKNAHPSGKWLEHAKTTMARKHIRLYLEKNSFLSRLKSFGK